MFPVDSIKVRLPFFVFHFHLLCSGSPVGSLIPIRPGIPLQTRMQVFATSPGAMYTGIGNAFTRISSTEGVRVLWRGVSSVIMGAGPAHAVHFGTYEAIKEVTGGNREGNANWLSARESPPPLQFCWRLTSVDAAGVLALAGASATIASDALMNPFDGKPISPASPHPPMVSRLNPRSGKTTNADAPIRISLHYHLRKDRFSKRRDIRFLRLVPDDAHHDRALHRRPIHRIRTREENDEFPGRLLTFIAHRSRRRRRRCSCGAHHPSRCRKDALADTRYFGRSGDPLLSGYAGRAQDHLATRRGARVYEGPHAAHGHAHAEQCVVLALV